MSFLDDYNRRMTLGHMAGYSNDIGTQMAYGAADNMRAMGQRPAGVSGSSDKSVHLPDNAFARAFLVAMVGAVMLCGSVWLIEEVGGSWGIAGVAAAIVGFIIAALGSVLLLLTALTNIKTILCSLYFWGSLVLSGLAAGVAINMPHLFGYGIGPVSVGISVFLMLVMVRGFITVLMWPFQRARVTRPKADAAD